MLRWRVAGGWRNLARPEGSDSGRASAKMPHYEDMPKAVGDPHLGLMYKPNQDHLEELMYDFVIDHKAYFGYYYAQAEKIHQEYNWDQLTKNAFEHLVKKFS